MAKGGNVNREMKIDVLGLRDFRADLNRAGDQFPKRLRQLNKDISEFVATRAQQTARGRGGVAAKAARSIRAGATQREATVTLNGVKYPYALGAEFGSKRYKRFERWRGNQWQPWGNNGVGYFLHPTIRKSQEDIVKKYGDAAEDLARIAFND